MKKTKLTSAVSLAAAAVLTVASVTSCGKKNSAKEKKTADQVLQNAYSSVEIELAEDINVSSLNYCPDTDTVLIEGYDDDYKNIYYTTDSEFTDLKKMDFKFQENENAFHIDINSEGNICILTCTTSFGDFDVPDFEDENFDGENFDWDAYEEARQEEYKVKIYDSEGNSISETKIEKTKDSYIDNILLFNNNEFVISCQNYEGNGYTLTVYDENGKSKGDVDGLSNVNYISTLGKIKDGTAIVSYYADDKQKASTLDFDNLKLGESFEYPEVNAMNPYIMRGVNEYSFFVQSSTGITGVKEDFKTSEEVLNWIDSDINGNYVNSVIALENGDFITSVSESEKTTLYRMTRKDVSEMNNVVMITVGAKWADDSISSAISEFNKANTEYRIKLKDYSEYDTEENEYTGAEDQLKNDILSGDAPDIIAVSSFSNTDLLASKGCFTDLYEFLDKDSDIKKDMFLPNILKMNEKNGKLYSIPESFYITTITAKTEFVGDKANWNIDDLIAAYDAMPDGMKLTPEPYREYVFGNFVYGSFSSFINYETKECSFNSPDMIKILEFCNNFEPDDRDWDNLNSDDEYWEQRQMEEQAGIRNNKVLLQVLYASSFRDFHSNSAGTFDNAPLTYVGYPTSNGNGNKIGFGSGYAITADSAVKDGAWEFIKQVYTEEKQDKLSYAFPVNMNSFNKMAEASTKPYVDPETGEQYDWYSQYYIGDQVIDIGNMSKEEVESCKEFILNIDSPVQYDNKVYEIVEEEAQSYFEGKQTAQEAADMMQNRIQIYISEQG